MKEEIVMHVSSSDDNDVLCVRCVSVEKERNRQNVLCKACEGDSMVGADDAGISAS